MSRFARRYIGKAVVPLTLALGLAAGNAFAQPGPMSSPEMREAETEVESQAIIKYWTLERMQRARPKDFPAARMPGSEVGVTRSPSEGLPPDARPGVAPGWKPGRTPQPDANLQLEFSTDEAVDDASQDFVQPQTSPPFGPPAFPADFGNYAPFNRWTWDGPYRQYPMSTIGKVFFTQNGQNFVCSASVIHRSTLATAGHCVHAGNNRATGWSTNVLFCPSFNASGPDPVRGCWPAVGLRTSFQWFNAGNSDRDYGCIVTRTSGTVVNNSVGHVTGWLGRAWNWPSRQSTFAWGYPAGAPFAGNRIITVVSTEWYQINMNLSEAQLSKYIGSDMTGGSSGGPWWFNMTHRSVEIAATDGSALTDPGQGGLLPVINGVNSHKRCNAAGCPAGSLFSQEMGSPQFRRTAADTNDSEDVFATCFNNGGTL